MASGSRATATAIGSIGISLCYSSPSTGSPGALARGGAARDSQQQSVGDLEKEARRKIKRDIEVASVLDASPASSAGIVKGDLILAVRGSVRHEVAISWLTTAGDGAMPVHGCMR